MSDFAFPRWPIALAAGGLLGSIAVHHAPDLVSRVQNKAVYTNCVTIDGDTLRCGSERIRLLGIDAAELPGHCAPGRDCAPGDSYSQQEALARFASGPLTVHPITTDRYGRTVASVTNAAGQNASCAALAAGATYKPQWDSRSEIQITCALAAIKRITVRGKDPR